MSDDGMLEYETETEEPEPPGTVPVDVQGTVATVETVPQHVTCYTVPVDPTDVAELLPRDVLRVRATVIAAAAVRISHSAAAGAIVPPNVPVVIHGTQRLFLLPGDPADVSVIVERRGD